MGKKSKAVSLAKLLDRQDDERKSPKERKEIAAKLIEQLLILRAKLTKLNYKLGDLQMYDYMEPEGQYDASVGTASSAAWRASHELAVVIAGLRSAIMTAEDTEGGQKTCAKKAIKPTKLVREED